ncbi:hypothetical protein C9J85_13635 [Haloferax sp. wsp5]|nr:hypothetical protein C9J85_13635 [Haloferax sp. wsp5]
MLVAMGDAMTADVRCFLCITVYGAILVFLFYGALLKDVEDGYLTVEPMRTVEAVVQFSPRRRTSQRRAIRTVPVTTRLIW